MTKEEMVAQLASQTGQSKAEAGKAFTAFVSVLQDAIVKEGSCLVPGLGTFAVKDRAARKGRNPQTGDEIDIKASRTVGFRAASGLKERVSR